LSFSHGKPGKNHTVKSLYLRLWKTEKIGIFLIDIYQKILVIYMKM